MSVKPRKAVEKLPVYTTAKSLALLSKEYGISKFIRLSANENNLGFSKKAKKALKRLTSRYPDGDSLDLREALSKKYSVPKNQIIAGNGSFELLWLAGLAYLSEGEETISPVPSFGWYKNVTLILGGKFVEVPVLREKNYRTDLGDVLKAVTEKTKIIWLCNPNNPTGTIFTQKELVNFLDSLRDDILVILDEAYIDFVTEEGYPDSISLLQKYKNILILRTFSKLEGLAGIRAGYGFANEEIISNLNKVRLPINITQTAQLAALASINDDSFKEKTKKTVKKGLELFYKELDLLGLRYVKSNTNFIFFETKKDSSQLLEQFTRRGILVRAGAEYGFPECLRVSIGTEKENKAFLKVLKELLGK